MSKGKDYKVIVPFRDLQDNKQFPNGRQYAVGEFYNNSKVTAKRLKELSSNKNKLGKPLLEKPKTKAKK